MPRETVDFEPNPSIPVLVRPAPVVRTVYIQNPATLPVPPAPVRRGATAGDIMARAYQLGLKIDPEFAAYLSRQGSTVIEQWFRSQGNGAGFGAGYGGGYGAPSYGPVTGINGGAGGGVSAPQAGDDTFTISGSRDGGLAGGGAIKTSTMLMLGAGGLGLFFLLQKK